MAIGACPPGGPEERATVETVYDGDSVRLADGRNVRLIGINTPEFGRDGAPDQPLAKAARRALVERLDEHGRTVGLRIGRERRDHYDRLLAHLYTADGDSIAAGLLRRGLGWHIAVPPNLAGIGCYREAEATARERGRGVHAQRAYRPAAADSLAADAGGFRLVRGAIGRVGASRHAFWLDLGGLTLRLNRDDLPYFGVEDPRRWEGRSLRVRGWIYRVDGQARMNLRHPAAIEWTDGPR